MSSNSSNRKKGNTIPFSTEPKRRPQISPAKRWCFTLNNYSEDLIGIISSIVPQSADVYIIAKEVGESGTPHLQGYIEFKNKLRPMSLIPTSRIHWEKAKGSKKSNFEYCSKEGNVFLQGGYKLPREIKTLKLEQLYQWELDILNTIKEEPDDRTIWWIWSCAGNIGKTSFCKYLTLKHDAICLAGKGADVRNGVMDYFNKKGDTPELVVFPIPRSYDTDYLSYEALENIKDMYFYSGKYEGGMICGNSPHLFVFANNEPNYYKCSEDRWKVINIDN